MSHVELLGRVPIEDGVVIPLQYLPLLLTFLLDVAHLGEEV